MGIEYSTEIAYGKAVDEKYLIENLPEFSEDPNSATWKFCTDIYPLLELVNAGDSWSGTEGWALVIKSTLSEVTHQSGVFTFKEPVSSEKLQFSQAYARLTGKIGTQAVPIVIGAIF